MLRPETVHVWAPEGSQGPLLQAGTEYMVSLLLEGRIQSGIVAGLWGEEARVLGHYQPAPQGYEGLLRRRITGGWEVDAKPSTSYLSIVFASESLEETARLAEEVADCLRAQAWGATRLGPRRLAAGVVEVLGDFSLESAVECGVRILGAKESKPVDVAEKASRLEKAYLHPGWSRFSGAEGLPRVGVVERPPYQVRIGLSIDSGFIATARIDGVFMAAPPAEPYSTIASIQGMPAGEQAELILEARFGGPVELYGIQGEDVVEAFRRALG